MSPSVSLLSGMRGEGQSVVSGGRAWRLVSFRQLSIGDERGGAVGCVRWEGMEVSLLPSAFYRG